MTDGAQTLLTEFDLPFQRKGRLHDITYDAGFHMLRMTFQERKRFTTIDLDKQSAAALAQELFNWAQQQDI
ncbi:MAG: hypothetical protein V3V13_02525 [Paracoccaceae bacterium]